MMYNLTVYRMTYNAGCTGMQHPGESPDETHMSRVAGKIEMIAHGAMQIAVGSSATQQALDFYAPLKERGFAGLVQRFP